jgi:hypothetical protein
MEEPLSHTSFGGQRHDDSADASWTSGSWPKSSHNPALAGAGYTSQSLQDQSGTEVKLITDDYVSDMPSYYHYITSDELKGPDLGEMPENYTSCTKQSHTYPPIPSTIYPPIPSYEIQIQSSPGLPASSLPVSDEFFVADNAGRPEDSAHNGRKRSHKDNSGSRLRGRSSSEYLIEARDTSFDETLTQAAPPPRRRYYPKRYFDSERKFKRHVPTHWHRAKTELVRGHAIRAEPETLRAEQEDRMRAEVQARWAEEASERTHLQLQRERLEAERARELILEERERSRAKDFIERDAERRAQNQLEMREVERRAEIEQNARDAQRRFVIEHERREAVGRAELLSSRTHPRATHEKVETMAERGDRVIAEAIAARRHLEATLYGANRDSRRFSRCRPSHISLEIASKNPSRRLKPHSKAYESNHVTRSDSSLSPHGNADPKPRLQAGGDKGEDCSAEGGYSDVISARTADFKLSDRNDSFRVRIEARTAAPDELDDSAIVPHLNDGPLYTEFIDGGTKLPIQTQHLPVHGQSAQRSEQELNPCNGMESSLVENIREETEIPQKDSEVASDPARTASKKEDCDCETLSAAKNLNENQSSKPSGAEPSSGNEVQFDVPKSTPRAAIDTISVVKVNLDGESVEEVQPIEGEDTPSSDDDNSFGQDDPYPCPYDSEIESSWEMIANEEIREYSRNKTSGGFAHTSQMRRFKEKRRSRMKSNELLTGHGLPFAETFDTCISAIHQALLCYPHFPTKFPKEQFFQVASQQISSSSLNVGDIVAISIGVSTFVVTLDGSGAAVVATMYTGAMNKRDIVRAEQERRRAEREEHHEREERECHTRETAPRQPTSFSGNSSPAQGSGSQAGENVLPISNAPATFTGDYSIDHSIEDPLQATFSADNSRDSGLQSNSWTPNQVSDSERNNLNSTTEGAVSTNHERSSDEHGSTQSEIVHTRQISSVDSEEPMEDNQVDQQPEPPLEETSSRSARHLIERSKRLRNYTGQTAHEEPALNIASSAVMNDRASSIWNHQDHGGPHTPSTEAFVLQNVGLDLHSSNQGQDNGHEISYEEYMVLIQGGTTDRQEAVSCGGYSEGPAYAEPELPIIHPPSPLPHPLESIDRDRIPPRDDTSSRLHNEPAPINDLPAEGPCFQSAQNLSFTATHETVRFLSTCASSQSSIVVAVKDPALAEGIIAIGDPASSEDDTQTEEIVPDENLALPQDIPSTVEPSIYPYPFAEFAPQNTSSAPGNVSLSATSTSNRNFVPLTVSSSLAGSVPPVLSKQHCHAFIHVPRRNPSSPSVLMIPTSRRSPFLSWTFLSEMFSRSERDDVVMP